MARMMCGLCRRAQAVAVRVAGDPVPLPLGIVPRTVCGHISGRDFGRVSFPVYLHVGAWTLHPHVVFEVLEYLVGVLLFLSQRRHRGDPSIETPGSRSWPSRFLAARSARDCSTGSKTPPPWMPTGMTTFLFGGKTVVGGLLGGMLAVEWSNARLGIQGARATSSPYRWRWHRDGPHRLLPHRTRRPYLWRCHHAPLGRGLRRRHPAPPHATL